MKRKILACVLAILLFLPSSGMTVSFAQSADLVQQITDFEAAKRLWERERNDQTKLLDEKESRLEQIKQSLLAKIAEIKTQKDDWDNSKKAQAQALAQRETELSAALQDKQQMLDQEKSKLEESQKKLEQQRKILKTLSSKDLAEKGSALPKSEASNSLIPQLNEKIRMKDQEILKLREDLFDFKNGMSDRESKKVKDVLALEAEVRQKEIVLKKVEERLLRTKQELDGKKPAQTVDDKKPVAVAGPIAADTIVRRHAKKIVGEEKAYRQKVAAFNVEKKAWQGKIDALSRQETELRQKQENLVRAYSSLQDQKKQWLDQAQKQQGVKGTLDQEQAVAKASLLQKENEIAQRKKDLDQREQALEIKRLDFTQSVAEFTKQQANLENEQKNIRKQMDALSQLKMQVVREKQNQRLALPAPNDQRKQNDLKNQKENLDQESQALSNQAKELALREQTLEAKKSELARSISDFQGRQKDLAVEQDKIRTQMKEFETAKERILSERQKFEKDRGDWETSRRQAEERLSQKETELKAGNEAWAERDKTFQAKQDSIRKTLAGFNAIKGKTLADKLSLQKERSDWELFRKQTEASLNQKETEIKARAAAAEALDKNARGQQEDVRKSMADFNAVKDKILADQLKLQKERDDWEQYRRQSEARLSQKEAALKANGEALDARGKNFQASQDTIQKLFAGFNAVKDKVLADMQNFQKERSDWEAYRRQAEERLKQTETTVVKNSSIYREREKALQEQRAAYEKTLVDFKNQQNDFEKQRAEFRKKVSETDRKIEQLLIEKQSLGRDRNQWQVNQQAKEQNWKHYAQQLKEQVGQITVLWKKNIRHEDILGQRDQELKTREQNAGDEKIKLEQQRQILAQSQKQAATREVQIKKNIEQLKKDQVLWRREKTEQEMQLVGRQNSIEETRQVLIQQIQLLRHEKLSWDEKKGGEQSALRRRRQELQEMEKQLTTKIQDFYNTQKQTELIIEQKKQALEGQASKLTEQLQVLARDRAAFEKEKFDFKTLRQQYDASRLSWEKWRVGQLKREEKFRKEKEAFEAAQNRFQGQQQSFENDKKLFTKKSQDLARLEKNLRQSSADLEYSKKKVDLQQAKLVSDRKVMEQQIAMERKVLADRRSGLQKELAQYQKNRSAWLNHEMDQEQRDRALGLREKQLAGGEADLNNRSELLEKNATSFAQRRQKLLDILNHLRHANSKLKMKAAAIPKLAEKPLRIEDAHVRQDLMNQQWLIPALQARGERMDLISSDPSERITSESNEKDMPSIFKGRAIASRG